MFLPLQQPQESSETGSIHSDHRGSQTLADQRDLPQGAQRNVAAIAPLRTTQNGELSNVDQRIEATHRNYEEGGERIPMYQGRLQSVSH